MGNIIVRTIATTGSAAPKEGEYLAVTRAKIESGRRAEFFDMRTSLMLPIMAARVKEGAIKSWSLSSVIFPGGESTAWDASTSSVYKDLASALTTGPAGTGGGGNAAIFAKVHPDKSYVAYVDSLRATSKVVRRELQRFVIVIDRSSSPSSAGQ